MTYYKDEDTGVIYFDQYENPSQVFTTEEWVIEKERLITGLQGQIASLQYQIDNVGQIIEILDIYPTNVKVLIEESNMLIPNTDNLQIKIAEKQSILNEIESL